MGPRGPTIANILFWRLAPAIVSVMERGRFGIAHRMRQRRESVARAGGHAAQGILDSLGCRGEPTALDASTVDRERAPGFARRRLRLFTLALGDSGARGAGANQSFPEGSSQSRWRGLVVFVGGIAADQPTVRPFPGAS